MIKKYDFYKTKYGKELLIDLIKLEDIEQYIIKANAHYLTYYDITFITHGTGNLFIDDFKCPIEKNSILFSSPNQIRNWQSLNTPKGFALIFEEDFLCSFFNDTKFVQNLSYFNNQRLKPYLKITDDEFDFLSSLLNKIDHEVHSEISHENHMLRALLYQILIWFDRKYCSSANVTEKITTSKYVSDFIRLVNSDFSSSHYVHQYADKLNITSGHLNDLIKKNLKTTAKQLIQNRILLESKRLLNYSELSISEIAWKLNFQDLSYFIRFFKKLTGQTPLMYRKNNP